MLVVICLVKIEIPNLSSCHFISTQPKLVILIFDFKISNVILNFIKNKTGEDHALRARLWSQGPPEKRGRRRSRRRHRRRALNFTSLVHHRRSDKF